MAKVKGKNFRESEGEGSGEEGVEGKSRVLRNCV